MPNYVYPAIGLIGGGTGALDAIDGTALADKDMAMVSVQGDKTYFYVLNATSGAAEASPGIIAPDANGGDKRWLLVGFTPVPAATGFTIAGGTTSKTLTVTADTSLDEAVAMSSKAPKVNPVFTGTETAQAATLNPGSELVASWANGWSGQVYETFTSDGKDIISAIETGGAGGCASGVWTTVTGKIYKIVVTITLTSGAAPRIYLRNGANSGWLLNDIQTLSGANNYNIVETAGGAGAYLAFYNVAVGNWSATITVTEFPLTVNGDAYLTGNARVVIPTFVNNAAAIAGGLVAGQFYRVNAATDPEPLYIVH